MELIAATYQPILHLAKNGDISFTTIGLVVFFIFCVYIILMMYMIGTFVNDKKD